MARPSTRSAERLQLMLPRHPFALFSVLVLLVAGAALWAGPAAVDELAGAIGSTVGFDRAGTSGDGLGMAALSLPSTIYEGPSKPFEPAAAADPSDPSHLVAASMQAEEDAFGVRRIWLHTHVSRDGGATWSSAPLPGGLSADPMHPLFSYDHFSDPTLAILPDGTVLLSGFVNRWEARDDGVVLAFHSGGGALVVARSHDGGDTWPDIRILRDGIAVNAQVMLLNDPLLNAPAGVVASFNDKPWLAQGPDGRVLLAWADLQFPPADMPGELYNVDVWFALSDDEGATWTAPRMLANGVGYPALPAVLSDGGLRIAYRNVLAGGPWDMLSSDDDGATWQHSTILPASEMGPVGRTALLGPTLLVQRFADHDRLVLPFPTAGESAPAQVLKVTHSDDGGATWSTPLALDGPTSSIPSPDGWNAPIALPSSAAVDEDGDVYVTSFHIAEGSDTADYKVVRLRDGVASEPLILEGDMPGPTYQRGHYMGMAGLGEGAYAVWSSGECAWGGPGSCQLIGARVDG